MVFNDKYTAIIGDIVDEVPGTETRYSANSKVLMKSIPNTRKISHPNLPLL